MARERGSVLVAIAIQNRKREARFDKAQRMLRALRRKVFDYEDEGKDEKCGRLITRCKARLAPRWKAQDEARARGPYSGLTRRELAASGTCETDWF